MIDTCYTLFMTKKLLLNGCRQHNLKNFDLSIPKNKITLIVGSSYGAGNYAMCGRAFDPFLTLAWPNAKYAVMGGAAAANTLLQIDLGARRRRGEEVDEELQAELLAAITKSYNEQESIFYGAARGWVDRIINPEETRSELIEALSIASTVDIHGEYKTGVLQT